VVAGTDPAQSAFCHRHQDQDGSRLFYEPLACWDADGNMKLVLAAEIPSLQNGGLAATACP